MLGLAARRATRFALAASPALLGAPEARCAQCPRAFADALLVFGGNTNPIGSRQAVPGGGDLWGAEEAQPARPAQGVARAAGFVITGAARGLSGRIRRFAQCDRLAAIAQRTHRRDHAQHKTGHYCPPIRRWNRALPLTHVVAIAGKIAIDPLGNLLVLDGFWT